MFINGSDYVPRDTVMLTAIRYGNIYGSNAVNSSRLNLLTPKTSSQAVLHNPAGIGGFSEAQGGKTVPQIEPSLSSSSTYG